MKGYIYNVETNVIVAIIIGDNNSTIENKANDLGYMGVDEYGLSYSDSGLEELTSTEIFEAETDG